MVKTMLSIDPGSAHCAWANWELRPDPLTNRHRWKCLETFETGPDEFLDQFKGWIEIGQIADRVAIEGFFLQPDKAKQQTGSSFGTVEVIGVVKHLCRWAGVPFEVIHPDRRDAVFTKMRAVGYRFPKSSADHVKSAVCVGAVAIDWRGLDHRGGDGVG